MIRTQSFTYGITASANATSSGFTVNTSMMGVAATGMMEQADEDETMNTEDDTFEGIESRIASGAGTNWGTRRLPTASKSFTARRAVSY